MTTPPLPTAPLPDGVAPATHGMGRNRAAPKGHPSPPPKAFLLRHVLVFFHVLGFSSMF